MKISVQLTLSKDFLFDEKIVEILDKNAFTGIYSLQFYILYLFNTKSSQPQGYIY